MKFTDNTIINLAMWGIVGSIVAISMGITRNWYVLFFLLIPLFGTIFTQEHVDNAVQHLLFSGGNKKEGGSSGPKG